jgi:hypothetical protein
MPVSTQSMKPEDIEVKHAIESTDIRKWESARREIEVTRQGGLFDTRPEKLKVDCQTILIPFGSKIIELGYGTYPPPSDSMERMLRELSTGAVKKPKDSSLSKYDVFFVLTGEEILRTPYARQFVELALTRIEKVRKAGEEYLIKFGQDASLITQYDWQLQITQEERVTQFSSSIDGFDLTVRCTETPMLFGKTDKVFEVVLSSPSALILPIVVDGESARAIFEMVEKHRR